MPHLLGERPGEMAVWCGWLAVLCAYHALGQTLLVGWADTMRVVQFTPRAPTHGGGAGGAGAGVGAAAVSGPSLAAEIVVMFRTDYSICGVAPCDEDLALLG